MCYFRLHIYCCGHPGERKLLRICPSGQLCPERDRRTVNGSKIKAECDRCRTTRFMKTIINEYDVKDGFRTLRAQARVRVQPSNSISQVAGAAASPKDDRADDRPDQESLMPKPKPLLTSPHSSPWNFIHGITEQRKPPETPPVENLIPRQRLARLDAQRCLVAEEEVGSHEKEEEEEEEGEGEEIQAIRSSPSLTCRLCGVEYGKTPESSGTHECGPLVARCSHCSELLRVEDAPRHQCEGRGSVCGTSFTYEMAIVASSPPLPSPRPAPAPLLPLLPVMASIPPQVRFPLPLEDVVDCVRCDDEFTIASPGKADREEYDCLSESDCGDEMSADEDGEYEYIVPIQDSAYDLYGAGTTREDGNDFMTSTQHSRALGMRERKLC